ncbi:MAG: DEAD/DEAH box helicase [Bacteroidetes bacterium]|nr:DEAD/DEAH box helicase [Bacteroidota bacterium]
MSNITVQSSHPPAPGARLLIRDQEWVVRNTDRTYGNDYLIHVTGLTPLVRDIQWQFIQKKESIIEVKPEETKLVSDNSPNYLASRLHIESLLRTTPPPDNKLYLGHRAAMDDLPYQREPALMALKRPRPRILIADGTGLGKTLEAGVLISELIRRGRGKRILVVSLASMLLQFQKELWTRFSIPLIRLDSIGINRVREQLPAGHNPFHHFDRAIISIDTLKNASTWRPFLENSNWDIVVIDEVQNVAKKKNQRGSLRHQLADILASRCDALIMLSATPHDGHAESFASLMNMLDPTVIADEKSYTKKDLDGKNLLIRRFKKDIREQAILQPRDVQPHEAPATPEEEHIFEIIADTPNEQLSQRTGDGWLLRTTMEKAVLSSPNACLKSVLNRIKKLEKAGKGEEHLHPWHLMKDSLEKIGPREFSKYQLLLDIISELNWTGKDTHDRLLIFTERIATLEFLENQLPKDLKLKKDAIRVLHGSLSDIDQQKVVDEFGRDQSSVRLLISTDVGSEGINLHYQCRRLIHFDIPWSLMRFQQRNGRIDRYGQKRRPQIFYLITQSRNEKFKGDTRILELLIEKEEQAEQNLGDPATLMALFDYDAEEKLVAKTIEARQSIEESERQLMAKSRAPKEDPEFDPLLDLLNATSPVSDEENVTGELPSLFESDYAYTKAAMTHIQGNWARGVGASLSVTHDDKKQRIIVTPQDLQARTVLSSIVNQLPVSARPNDSQFILSSNPKEMMESIRKSRELEHDWPDMHYLWPVHPFMDWMTDKIRMSFRRLEAPAIRLPAMDTGTFSYLITILWPNRKGVTIFQRWYLVTGNIKDDFEVRPLEDSSIYEKLRSSRLSNQEEPSSLLQLAQVRVPQAIIKAQEHAKLDRQNFEHDLQSKLAQRLKDLEELQQRQETHVEDTYQVDKGIEQVQLSRKEKELERIRARFQEFQEWIRSSMTMEADPYIHIAAVILAEEAHGI